MFVNALMMRRMSGDGDTGDGGGDTGGDDNGDGDTGDGSIERARGIPIVIVMVMVMMMVMVMVVERGVLVSVVTTVQKLCPFIRSTIWRSRRTRRHSSKF